MRKGKIYELIERLNVAMNRLDGAYYIWARRHNVKENMLSLLYALGDGRPHTQRDISRDWLIPKTTVNTLTKELVSGGMAYLEGGREKRIVLTESGMRFAREALDELSKAEVEAMEETLRIFPEEFITAVEKYTEVISAKLNIKG